MQGDWNRYALEAQPVYIIYQKPKLIERAIMILVFPISLYDLEPKQTFLAHLQCTLSFSRESITPSKPQSIHRI